MCERASLDLTPHPTAPAAARRFVTDRSVSWAVPDLADEAALLTSELVTNAIQHAGTPTTITVSLSRGVLEVDVADRDARAPVPPPHRVDVLQDVDAFLASLTAGDHLPGDAPYAARDVGPAQPSTAGRGLLIVAALADQWGVAERRAGKEVWFALAVPPSARPAPPCPCVTMPGHPVGSGRRVTTRG